MTVSAPTWQELVRREPRLLDLLREAQAYRPRPGFCANAIWYGYGRRVGLRERLTRLVGWGRPDRDPVLSTSAAYDVAYETVYQALPDCQHADILCWPREEDWTVTDPIERLYADYLRRHLLADEAGDPHADFCEGCHRWYRPWATIELPLRQVRAAYFCPFCSLSWQTGHEVEAAAVGR